MQSANHARKLPSGPFSLMYRMYRYILPGVRSELKRWREKAECIPDPELRKQAIASMTSKEFHCIGGAVYASGNIPKRRDLMRLITAYQTISDYLDNLCDRSTSMCADDFRALHQAMIDAADPQAELHDYYRFRSETEDGGYLNSLVLACQSILRKLPSYSVVQPYVLKLVGLYTDLQVYKHIHPDQREQALLTWWEEHREMCPDLKWNEFAAATGSTLCIFMLFLAASHKGLSKQEAEAIYQAYFPYICALHILLDYLIDQEEDQRGGDLNFCSYYSGIRETTERMRKIAEQASRTSKRLPGARFHLMIVEGLLALYLSDPKVSQQEGVTKVTRQLMHNSPWTRIFFWINSKWIRSSLI